MTKQQLKYSKAMTMLAAYLQLAKMQADMVIAESMAKRDTKRKLKHTSEFCGSVVGNLCTIGNMDKDAIIDLAGEIDDILRPNVIEDGKQ
jgi:uncharacterized protein YqgC (DUF456 family)